MYKHDNITLIILAGELGTRVSALVPDKSKVLAPINGRPFISYLLDQISRAGLRKVILCTGYKIGEVKQTFRDAHNGVSLIYSHESSPSGTGGFLHYDLPLK